MAEYEVYWHFFFRSQEKKCGIKEDRSEGAYGT